METKISVISIILEEKQSSPQVNQLLTEFGSYIVARMGVPYKNKGIISVVIDAPSDVTSTLSGKLGMIRGASIKTITSKVK